MTESRQVRLFLSLLLIIAGVYFVWQGQHIGTTFRYSEDLTRGNRININFATREQLLEIELFDEEIADSILEVRAEIQYYQNDEDLMLVYGIAENNLELVKRYIFY